MSTRSSISRVSSRLLLALALCAPACGDDQQQTPDAQVMNDAAAIDAPVIDSMQPMIDAGIPMIDAGIPMIDAGIPMIDAGAPMPDAGIPMIDAGIPMIDAGAPMPDAGVLDPAATCTTLCAYIEQCFMQPAPECLPECTGALGNCSQPELVDLDACAAVSCNDLADCIQAVPCVGGGSGPVCGNSVCEPGEDCGSCPQDCGACVCGDGICSPGECAGCTADCPGGCVCPHDECTVGPPLDLACTKCTADICAVDPFCCTDMWDGICVSETESICGKMCPEVCGDGSCSAGEDSMTCPQDCGPPVQFCGDSTCDMGEDCGSCPGDCGTCVCGDGACNLGECTSCAADCPDGCFCPHDECTVGAALDPGCGQCAADVCAADPFCCTTSWDAVCVSEAASICGSMCPEVCGDGICSPGEDSMSCPQDCGGEACGDGICDPGEDAMSCPPDCGPGTCGNGACDPWEDPMSCPTDCSP